MLRCVNLLESIDDGEIFLDSLEISEFGIDKDEIRSKIGSVFQSFNLFPHLTVMQNLVLAPILVHKVSKLEAEKRATELLGRFGLSEKANQYPLQLSGGQQQRVAIARALINNPAIILADEPSGNLDSSNAQQLHQLFFELRNEMNQTFVIVTHNNELADMADRKLTIKDGII